MQGLKPIHCALLFGTAESRALIRFAAGLEKTVSSNLITPTAGALPPHHTDSGCAGGPGVGYPGLRADPGSQNRDPGQPRSVFFSQAVKSCPETRANAARFVRCPGLRLEIRGIQVACFSKRSGAEGAVPFWF